MNDDRLNAYLRRIGFEGEPRVDLATLTALHRAHLLSIAYENLDIHRGRELSLRQDDMIAKIVGEARGGWCYEMNGTFAWALREIGFEVRLMASTVGRSSVGRTIEGNHLILLVQLDRPYLADVGFGNGFLEPLPLAEGTYQQGYLTYQLHTANGLWWLENHQYGGVGYDFTLDTYQLADFAPQSHELQTSPESGFVRTIVCHRFTPTGIVTLRGLVLRTISEVGANNHVIKSFEEYQQIIENTFDLHLPDLEALWEKAQAQHLTWSR